MQRNILPASTAAPGIQGSARELEKQMVVDRLRERIKERPDVGELVKEGILKGDPRVGGEEDGESYEEKMEGEYAKREGGA